MSNVIGGELTVLCTELLVRVQLTIINNSHIGTVTSDRHSRAVIFGEVTVNNGYNLVAARYSTLIP